jgi:hypothetical protein
MTFGRRHFRSESRQCSYPKPPPLQPCLGSSQTNLFWQPQTGGSAVLRMLKTQPCGFCASMKPVSWRHLELQVDRSCSPHEKAMKNDPSLAAARSGLRYTIRGRRCRC